jgi:hypothetical protein
MMDNNNKNLLIIENCKSNRLAPQNVQECKDNFMVRSHSRTERKQAKTLTMHQIDKSKVNNVRVGAGVSFGFFISG